MPLFAKKKDLRVQTLILKLVNNHCPELKAMLEGPRADSRVNLTVVVMVVPLKDSHLQADRAFSAVTKEFSCAGTSIVTDQPVKFGEAVVGFRVGGEMAYFRATAKHASPMGGGFHQLGLQLVDVVAPSDYPELEAVQF
jgi:hypothetical protein